MKTKISLFLILACGVAYSLLTPLQNQIDAPSGVRGFMLWTLSLKLFAIPLFLLGLSFSKNAIVKLVIWAWATWLTALSLLVLWQAEIVSLGTSSYGFSFIGLIVVLSLTLSLSCLVDLTPKLNKPTENPSASDTPSQKKLKPSH